MKHRRVFAALALAGLGVLGCSGSEATKKQLAELEKDLVAVRADQDRLEERLQAMELSATVGAQARSENAAPAPRGVERPRLKVVRVAPDQPGAPAETDAVAPGERPESDGIPPGPDSSDARPAIRGSGDRLIKTGDGDEGAHRSEKKARGPSAAATDRTVGAYEAALALVRAGRYEEARERFERLLGAHASHLYADNARYWAAECDYALGDYEKALKGFADVIARHPDGNKVPDALLKLGMTQARLGKEREARASFAMLNDKYPETQAARRIPAH